MNQLCKVCGEPAAGYHFGAFTCEGCKSFFGRTYNNLSQVHECKNGGACIINKQNRTSCKACRLKKCLFVGMSKSGSRYGRRSNWFKIHCLLQEQAASMCKSPEGMSLPEQLTSLPTQKQDERPKLETAISSPESTASDSGIEIARRSLIVDREFKDGDCSSDFKAQLSSRDFVANFGLYTLNPGLSFLQASQLYSRFYPPMLYHGLASQQLLNNRHGSQSVLSAIGPPRPSSPPVKNESATYLVSPESSPRQTPPTPPYSVLGLSSPFVPRKREAESPLDDLRFSQSSPSEQDAPIDLRIKRRKLSSPSENPTTPPTSPEIPVLRTSISPQIKIPSVIPVDLSTKA